MESRLTNQMRTDGVAPIEELTIRSLTTAVSSGYALEEVDFQGLFTRPGWGKDAASLGQVE